MLIWSGRNRALLNGSLRLHQLVAAKILIQAQENGGQARWSIVAQQWNDAQLGFSASMTRLVAIGHPAVLPSATEKNGTGV
jgi:hypothetical protein